MTAPTPSPQPSIPDAGGDSRWPLAVGFAVALVLHAGLLPVLVSGYGTGLSKSADRVMEVDEPPLPPRDDLALGRDTPRVSTLSWISHEDYRELVAPRTNTEQPALQETADPVAQAPPIRDATPPMPRPQPESPLGAAPLSGPLQPVPDGELAMIQPVERTDAAEPTPPSPQPSEARPAAAPSPESRPTSAARDEQTVDPTMLTDSDLQQTAGNVLVGQGIEITTARPDITIITALFASGVRDTRVELKFNREGRVDEAQLLVSTGVESVDAAVLASLYKWKAAGATLEIADPHITVTLDYRFTKPR